MILVVILCACYWYCIILGTFKIASKVCDGFYWCSFILNIVMTAACNVAAAAAAAIKRHSVQFS